MKIARLAALAFLLLSCRPDEAPKLPAGPEDPAKNLAQLDVFADRVQTEAMSAAWVAATDPWSAVAPRSFGVLPLLLLTDAEVVALHSQLNDPRDSQCLRAVHSVALRMQSESDRDVAEALKSITALRQQIPDLSQMFTDEPDLARRKMLWSSQARIATELEPLLRRLVLARNQWAWQRSQSGYLELMREHRGYDWRVAKALEEQVRQSLAAREVAKSEPWEFELIDPALAARMASRFDEAHCVQRASFVLQFLGLPPNPPELQLRDVKQSAFSSFAFYPLDPPANQAITVRPGAGIVPHWSAFHEFGHAAMSLLTERTSCRTSRRPISPAVSESCAKIAERLFYSEEWLRSQGVPAKEIASLRDWERQSELMRVRGILADIEFERALYDDPAGVEVGREFPAWTLKRNLAFEPLARVDYLLARCAQAAVYRRLRQMPGGLTGEPARRFLREQVFRGATELRFEEWFRKVAGAEPNCTAWLEDVAN